MLLKFLCNLDDTQKYILNPKYFSQTPQKDRKVRTEDKFQRRICFKNKLAD